MSHGTDSPGTVQLLPCPACNHPVSPRATMCPKCGDPLAITTQPESSVSSSSAHASPPVAPVSDGKTGTGGKAATPTGNSQGTSNWAEPFKDGKATATPSGNAMTTVVCVLLMLAILFAGGAFLWREQKAKEAQAERSAQQQIQRAVIEDDLAAATERLEKLRAAQPMEFAIYGSRQFEEAPHGKGMFDTKRIQNGIPERCVLVARPSRMTNHGLVTTTLNATKLTRSQFNMTITAQTGITSQQTDFYDVYEAVEQEDLGRVEVRISELRKKLSSEP